MKLILDELLDKDELLTLFSKLDLDQYADEVTEEGEASDLYIRVYFHL
jgi:hypothetical protein